MKIHHGEQSYSASATSQQTGYEASNLVLPQVRRAWRSSATTEQVVTLDMGSSKTPASLWVQEVNWATATIERSADGAAWSSVGTLTSYQDIHGRRKGLIAIGIACRFVRATIPNGTPTDGAAYFSIGAAYLFLNSESAAIPPEWGHELAVAYPQSRRDLPNGRSVTVELGAPQMTLRGQFPPKPAEDAAKVIRLARAGTVGIDMELTASRERAWPMRDYESGFTQRPQNVAVWPVQFTLKEVA